MKMIFVLQNPFLLQIEKKINLLKFKLQVHLLQFIIRNQ